MAYAYRLDDPQTAYIRLSRADLAGERLRCFLVLDKVAHPLGRAVLRQDTLILADDLCEVERIILRARNRQVFVVLRDEAGTMPEHAEVLLFHHSFFAPFFDYAKAVPDTRSYARPGLLACFTHAYDDNKMLRFWEAHYSRFVPHRQLYVLDHGSPVSPRAVLHPETNVVPLPRGAVDHANMARFCGSFQRFLLSQFRWVLHSDADELLVHEDGDEGLLGMLGDESRQGILAPRQAFDVLHDPAVEAPLRPGESVSAQRRHLLPADALYHKPMLASMPVSWLQGFHLAFEEHEVRLEPALWLLHLQSADAGMLLEKNRKWNALPLTDQDKSICPQSRPVEAAALEDWFAGKLRGEGLVSVPERLRGLF